MYAHLGVGAGAAGAGAGTGTSAVPPAKRHDFCVESTSHTRPYIPFMPHPALEALTSV